MQIRANWGLQQETWELRGPASLADSSIASSEQRSWMLLLGSTEATLLPGVHSSKCS